MLLIVYCGLMTVGIVGCALVGIVVDQINPALGVTAFVSLFLLTSCLCWILALRLTAPIRAIAKPVTAGKAA
jgi:hypothetical protein